MLFDLHPNQHFDPDRNPDSDRLGFDPDQDVSIDDSKVNYQRPGVYIVTYSLSRGTPNANGGVFRTDFGTANLIIVVEDAA